MYRILKPLLRSLVWTLVFIGGLTAVDRLFYGKRIVPGWVAVNRLADMPDAVGEVPLPAYFPKDLRWPPTQLFYRVKPGPSAWWYKSAGLNGQERIVWIGNSPDGPPELTGLSACLTGTDQKACPTGWVLLSRDGLFLLSNLPPLEVRRILDGLGKDRGIRSR